MQVFRDKYFGLSMCMALNLESILFSIQSDTSLEANVMNTAL